MQAVEPFPDDDAPGASLALGGPVTASVAGPAVSDAPAVSGVRSRRRRRARGGVDDRHARRAGRHALTADARRELLWITVVYLAARAAVIIAAVLLDAIGHHNLQGELAHWDGLWYRDVANNGYPRHLAHPLTHQNNLGFFPLFPLTIFLGEHVLELITVHNQIWCSTFAGVFISGIGGLIATVFVHKLCEGWWDRRTARRATVLFVVFPGAIVFSMVYSEGLLLPLTAVCIWALERRRWVLAGTMAAFGTAVQPVGLALCAVCGVCALRELWRGGWRARDFRLSVLATAMSGIGILSFFVFLWAWVGTPFANYITQHDAWSEKTDPFALVHILTREVPRFDPSHFNHPMIDLNDVAGFVGAVIMLYELWLLWRYRRELSLPAITWSLAITFLAFTSEYVPPNPRMMITAFPMLMLLARRVRGSGFSPLVILNSVLLVGLGLLTFYEHVLRP